MDVLRQDLKVMDASAISLSRENNIPIVVFSIHAQDELVNVLQGNGTCTIVGEEK
jgi:uridylate kinase